MELDLGELGLEGLGGAVGDLDGMWGDVTEVPEHLVGGQPAAVERIGIAGARGGSPRSLRCSDPRVNGL